MTESTIYGVWVPLTQEESLMTFWALRNDQGVVTALRLFNGPASLEEVAEHLFSPPTHTFERSASGSWRAARG